MRRFLILAILVGVGFLAPSDRVSLSALDVFTPVVSAQPKGDDKDRADDKDRDRAEDKDRADDKDKDRAVAIDDLFAKVAKKHPEFGGMIIDEEEDTIVVFLLRGGDLDAVVRTLKKVFGEQNLPQKNAHALEAKYSFLELKKLHDRLAIHVLGLPGVVLFAIDHAKNRLVIGVENSQGQDQVERQLAALGIPREAVDLIETGPIEFLSSLNDFHRPVVGGLEIQYPADGDQGPDFFGCTLGFNAIREGALGFVTNSHCSFIQGTVDATDYYQPSFADLENEIGFETVDPGFQDCFCIPVIGCLFTCRQSDSNFSQTLLPQADTALGFIARPQILNTMGETCFNVDPSTQERVPNRPEFCAWNGVSTFQITAKAPTPSFGTTVTKVGAITGRTQGTVVLPSVTIVLGGGRLLLNQVLATFAVVQGDSGAPVIRGGAPDPSGNPTMTSLQGITVGAVGRTTRFAFFSPISGVEADLGPLTVDAP